MNLRQIQIHKFRKHIFEWWKNNKRDLPWRKSFDPYRIWISEVMLQQTQVARVIPVYGKFLRKFPTVEVLALAKLSDVIRIWKGMGYNRRAVYLQKTAKIIVERYDGKFPENESELVKLPGLGRYTARALLVFAFKNNVAAVDTNINKIIIHFFFKNKTQKLSTIQSVADKLIPYGRSWEWHQALMDYGAMALPNITTLKKIGRKTVPFKSSTRYYRGRIIDLLRKKTIRKTNMSKYLIQVFRLDRNYIQNLFISLEKDGLIKVEKTGIINLP
jgi:A/G-specific adenine glycosylase